MVEGDHTYYSVQYQLIAEGERDKPDSLIEPVAKLGEWSDVGKDGVFGQAFEPWAGSGNDYKPTNKAAYESRHSVWARTGYSGWWEEKYAMAALTRLRDRDERGQFDRRDHRYSTAGVWQQAQRHRFRVIKRVVSKHTTVLLEEPLKGYGRSKDKPRRKRKQRA